MGTNTKLNVGFSRRHWETLGCTGDTASDTGYQNTWEVSRGQPGPAGILVDYTGGKIGDALGSGTPTARAARFLDQLEPVLPGIRAAWDGNVQRFHWPSHPWSKTTRATSTGRWSPARGRRARWWRRCVDNAAAATGCLSKYS